MFSQICPLGSTANDSASVEIVIPGSSRRPSEFASTTSLSALSTKLPARVYAIPPIPRSSSTCTWKNPRPSINISNGPFPGICEPCVKFCCVPDSRTPSPTYNPVGRLSPFPFSTPGCTRSTYSRSSKFTREDLNPSVLTFARLFAVTSSRVLSARSPEAADCIARMAISICLLKRSGRSLTRCVRRC